MTTIGALSVARCCTLHLIPSWHHYDLIGGQLVSTGKKGWVLMQAEGDRLTAERIMLHKSRADMAAQLARLKAIQACTSHLALLMRCGGWKQARLIPRILL